MRGLRDARGDVQGASGELDLGSFAPGRAMDVLILGGCIRRRAYIPGTLSIDFRWCLCMYLSC